MQNKVLVGVGVGIVAICLLSVVGYGIWQTNSGSVRHKKTKLSAQDTNSNDSSVLSLDNSQGQQQQQAQTSTLGVSNDKSIGGLQSNVGQQNNSQSSTPNGPETFGQYEKYKENQGAMMADIVAGTGADVKVDTKVAIYYKGYLTNGTLFDQSRLDKPGGKLQPLIFTEGEHKVVIGLEQGIFGMKVGGTRRIIIPPAYGYGANPPQGSGIPANAILIFDIELVATQ